MPGNLINYFRYISILTLIQEVLNASQIRAVWQWNAPHVNNIYDYISYDADLKLLCRMTINTFDYIHNYTVDYIKWPLNWFKNIGDIEIDYDIQYQGKLQSSVLSPKDRLLRYFMFYTGHKVHQLIVTFGQAKSIIYQDVKHISRQIVLALGREWLSLPAAGSPEYNGLIGAGVFTDDNGEIIFDNVPYISDVTWMRIQRPTFAQRSYYDGHKRCHTVGFHCTHSGTGRIYSIVGPIPGCHNDIHCAYNTLIYQETNTYLSPGHGVLSDLAYYHLGTPFICRIAYQESYTVIENFYNMRHSRCRVVSENWYGRFNIYWSYFDKPWAMLLDDIGLAFRSLAITTNIIITIQDPLRR